MTRWARSISKSFSVLPPLAPVVPGPHIAGVLDSEFSYVGEGGSCIAFASDDGYVLKFFKTPAAVVAQFAEWQIDLAAVDWPTVVTGDALATARNKMRDDFVHARRAYDELREETALVYGHFAPGPMGATPNVERVGVIDLTAVPFLLQRRLVLVGEILERHRLAGNNAAASDLIVKLCNAMGDLWRREWADSSMYFHHNVAVDDVNADIRLLDACDLRPPDEPAALRRWCVDQYVAKSSQWLRLNHPHLSDLYEAELAEHRARVSWLRAA